MAKEEVIEVFDDPLDEYKIYKEKPYKNSNGDPFGVTINGRAKDYIQAHNKVRELWKKGKIYTLEYKVKDQLQKGKIKLLSVIATKTIIDAVVEVIPQKGPKGNVQLKAYNPSQNRKKGATTELRKLSDYEYSQVEVLKGMIVRLLDRFIAGDSVENVLQGCKNDADIKEIIYDCDLCNYKTKFKAGLKTHKTRIHAIDHNKCESCGFTTTSKIELKEHVLNSHSKKDENRKRPAPVFTCEISVCASSFNSREKLMEHEQNQHPRSNQAQNLETIENSPSSSPSRKKTAASNDINAEDDGIIDEEMTEAVDIQESIRNQREIQGQLEKKIRQLELKILEEKEEKEKVMLELDRLKRKNESETSFGGFTQKLNKKPFKIPNHLKSVQDKHLTRLCGFKMRYCSPPDGACLTNCLTAHISCTEEEEERRTNNRRVNHHIADNFDNYYKNKIILPYIETIGVGPDSRTIKCDTQEEFISFLRSEDSLCVFSNYQEVLAIANMLNIIVRIFTYGIGGDETRCEWKEVFPDPEMSASAHFPKGWVPDLYLYNSDQTHYDLLVAEDHRLALLGLIGSKSQKIHEQIVINEENDDLSSVPNNGSVPNDSWQSVDHKKKKKKQVTPEKFLDESEHEDYDAIDLEELDEEVTLARGKNRGHKRTNPSAPSESVQKKQEMLNCTWKNCKMQLESQGLLNAHMKEHEQVFQCDVCDDKFTCERDLKQHMTSKHEYKEWNCDNCSFQGSSSSELINHLQLTGHQPSKTVQNSKSEITSCYTCKQEFSSYWSLMNHRKQKHPSHKMCRYFLMNQCIHGVNCWYRHDEPMETDHSNGQSTKRAIVNKCNVCDKKFENSNSLRSHKKNEHMNITLCQKFMQGNCERSDDDCLYAHRMKEAQKETSQKSVFQFAPQKPFPPDQTEMIMKTLNMVLQKMEMMEKVFQQNLQ